MQKIKELRLEKGLTQKYLADVLGVDQSAVTKWETGVALPTADKLPKLAQLLGCTIDELYQEYHTTSEE